MRRRGRDAEHTATFVDDGRRRRRPKWPWILALVVVCAGGGYWVYHTFFHIYDKGDRTLAVNGEDVEQVYGFRVHHTTWVKASELHTFLTHVQDDHSGLTGPVKTVDGIAYVRMQDVASELAKEGDKSTFQGYRLSVSLPASRHYTYVRGKDVVRQQQVVVDGKPAGYMLSVVHEEATYEPVVVLTDILTKTDIHSAWNGTTLQLNEVSNAAPAPIQNQSQYMPIAFGKGQAIYAPVYSFTHTPYVPIKSLQDALSQTGWTSTSSDWTWQLTPSSGAGKAGQRNDLNAAGSAKPSSQTPVSMAFVPFYSGDPSAFDDVMNHGGAYNALAVDTWTVDDTGSLTGSAPSGAANQASAQGDEVYAMVSNIGTKGADGKVMTTILTNFGSSQHLEDEITKLMLNEGFDGAVLDFESIPSSNRSAYSQFVTNLASDLHAEGKRLVVVIPPDTGSQNEPWNDAYDQAVLGAAADGLVIMAYDYSYPGGKPGPIAPLPWVQQTLAYTVSRVPADKVILGIDAYGYDWHGKRTTSVSLTNVDHFLSARKQTPQWDATSEAPWFTWKDSKGLEHTVYYENAKSTSAKLALAQTYGIGGIAVWRAGLEDQSVLQGVAGYVKGPSGTSSGK